MGAGCLYPNWYATKKARQSGADLECRRHVYGPITFFEDAERLRDCVASLTDRHEAANSEF